MVFPDVPDFVPIGFLLLFVGKICVDVNIEIAVIVHNGDCVDLCGQTDVSANDFIHSPIRAGL